MDNKGLAIIFVYCVLASALLLGALALMTAVSDETQEYFEDGCLVKVHKDNRLRGEDTIDIKRYC